MEGLILFYKPKGITSYDVIRRLKKITDEKHIGHGGTLDPLAEGLLILGIGKEATKKLAAILKNEEKEYEAVVRFGAVSETYDAEGPVREILNFKAPILNEIETAVKSFVGEILQTPPPYSAVKIKGKPAYERARAGEKIELEPKKVFIKSIEILDFLPAQAGTPPDLKIRVACGSGVYIRSLAHDLGQTLKCGAYLADLKRTRIGKYRADEGITFEDIEKDFIELRAEVFGTVQDVNFRSFTIRQATKLGLNGWVRNTEKGTVEILAQGKEKVLQEFLRRIKNGPAFANVQKVESIFRKPQEIFRSFSVKH